jgi:hypothetical protein
MSKKPITITKVSTGYHVHVLGVPVIRDENGIHFDRAKAGLKTARDYVAPTVTEPHVFPKADQAARAAHSACRYALSRGDMVDRHTELVGIGGSHDAWWDKALN